MADSKQAEVFSLLPSVCLSEHFSFDTSTEELIKHFGDNLQCKIPTIFRSEISGRELKLRIEEQNTLQQLRKQRKLESMAKVVQHHGST